MKQNFKFTISAITLSLIIVFSACKYEEGPGISLRNKRDRITNVWAFKSIDFDGQDYTSTFNTDSFICVFEMYKAGAYSFGYRYPDGSPLVSGNPGDNYNYPSAFIGASNPFQRDVRGGGLWTFDDKHNTIQMAPELSHEEGDNEISIYEIIMLRNDNLKLRGNDRATGKEINVEFVPLNR